MFCSSLFVVWFSVCRQNNEKSVATCTFLEVIEALDPSTTIQESGLSLFNIANYYWKIPLWLCIAMKKATNLTGNPNTE